MPTEYETACIEGVRNAFALHEKFSGGLPLSFAPEGFVQGQIALALAERGVIVQLESPVYATLCEAGAELRGKPFKGIGGRIDVVTWWKNGTPRHLIEVKMLRHGGAIAGDVGRLKTMLKRGGFRQGLIVVYAEAIKEATVANRISSAAKLQGCEIADRSVVQLFRSDWVGGVHWQAACFRVCHA
jgi:hypothetical protein